MPREIMGVKSCYRNGCNNIMCDTYIESIGYICYECKKKFKESVGADTILSEGEIIRKLSNFISTAKNYGDIKSIDDFFKDHS